MATSGCSRQVTQACAPRGERASTSAKAAPHGSRLARQHAKTLGEEAHTWLQVQGTRTEPPRNRGKAPNRAGDCKLFYRSLQYKAQRSLFCIKPSYLHSAALFTELFASIPPHLLGYVEPKLPLRLESDAQANGDDRPGQGPQYRQ